MQLPQPSNEGLKQLLLPSPCVKAAGEALLRRSAALRSMCRSLAGGKLRAELLLLLSGLASTLQKVRALAGHLTGLLAMSAAGGCNGNGWLTHNITLLPAAGHRGDAACHCVCVCWCPPAIPCALPGAAGRAGGACRHPPAGAAPGGGSAAGQARHHRALLSGGATGAGMQACRASNQLLSWLWEPDGRPARACQAL